MLYTYEVTDNPPICKILVDGADYDISGPWESTASAEAWAIEFVAKLNSELV
jgi:hypothetical protein